MKKEKKAKAAKALAITSAVILILTFIIKEILKDNLKDFHDSVVQAESQFGTESGHSLIWTRQESEESDAYEFDECRFSKVDVFRSWQRVEKRPERVNLFLS
jgi:hypothetical protein